MNRGAGGCEYPRQDSRAYRRFDNQVTSSSRLSHRVSHVRSDSKRQLTNNRASYSTRAKRRSLAWEQGIDCLIRLDLPQVKVLKVHFDVQEISSVIWAMAKLVVGGLELTTPGAPGGSGCCQLAWKEVSRCSRLPDELLSNSIHLLHSTSVSTAIFKD